MVHGRSSVWLRFWFWILDLDLDLDLDTDRRAILFWFQRVEQYDCYIRNSHVDMIWPLLHLNSYLCIVQWRVHRLIFPPNIIHCSRVLPPDAFKTPIFKGKGWQHSGAINNIFPPKHWATWKFIRVESSESAAAHFLVLTTTTMKWNMKWNEMKPWGNSSAYGISATLPTLSNISQSNTLLLIPID